MNGQSFPEMLAALQAAIAEANTQLGRTQGPEQFDQFQPAGFLDAPMPYTSRQLNLDRPLSDIFIRLRGRLTVTVANYTAVAPESFANLLQSVRLNGQHVRWGSQTLVEMSGSTAFALAHMTQDVPGSEVLTGAGGNRAASPGRPYSPVFAGTTAASPYDFDVIWRIPMAPMMGLSPTIKRQESSFWLHEREWQNTLQLRCAFGDATALGDPTGATTAFTAFGSATGDPLCQIYLAYGIWGSMREKMNTGFILRSEQTFNQFTTLQTSAILAILQKRITPAILVKSGTAQTVVSAGVTTFAALSDVQLDRTQIQIDNKPIRRNDANLIEKAYYEGRFGVVHPQGYLYLPFDDSQNIETSFRSDALSGGPEFRLVTDVISASAANRQSIVQEQIIGGPFVGAS
jgi:hypothetical protein